MILRDFFTEAANPAQRAAIAIAMKKAHKKPKSLKEFARTDDEGREFMSWSEFLAIVTPAMRKWGFRPDYKNPQIMYSRQGRGRDEYYIIILDPQEDMVQYSFMTMEGDEPEMHENSFVSMDSNGAHSLMAKADDGYSLSDLKPDLAEDANPANTLYFFDVERGGRSFNHLDLKIMGLKQSQKGKWYYQPGRDSTDLITNATIKHLEKTLNVPARAWQRPTAEDQIAEACWKGYHREGNKKMFGKTYPNCVKNTNEAEQCPECGGPMFSELMINEKQDACYYKVKSRYKVWPSAYASGALVQCRKKGAANWGNKSRK